MTVPRGLTPEEATLWRQVTATVTPLKPEPPAVPAHLSLAEEVNGGPELKKPKVAVLPARPTPSPAHTREKDRSLTSHGLDGTWERRLAKAQVAPELTIDLHGLTLDQAHARLMSGIAQALPMGVRVMLLIAGKPRPHGEHDSRGERRGVIRAKLLDWLAAGPYASQIAAVRPAHPRHGGAGALYIVLRRGR